MWDLGCKVQCYMGEVGFAVFLLGPIAAGRVKVRWGRVELNQWPIARQWDGDKPGSVGEVCGSDRGDESSKSTG